MGGPRKWFKTLVGLKKSSKSHQSEGDDCKNGLVDKPKSKEQGVKTNVSLPAKSVHEHGEVSNVSTTFAQSSVASVNSTAVVEDIAGAPVGSNELAREEFAAIRIQTAFRGLLARKALRALKGLVRLQALARGQAVRKQAAMTLRCMQALVRVQARVRARRASAIEEEKNQQRFDYQNHDQKLETGWCDKLGSLDDIHEKERKRQEAAAKRERARSYAFTHQWQPNSRNNPEPSVRNERSELDRSNVGWNWLERWMATHPWKNKGLLEQARMDGSESISSNTIDQQQSTDMTPTHHDSRASAPRHLRGCSIGNGNECAVTVDPQSKRKLSLPSPEKGKTQPKNHSLELQSNQPAEVRKSPLRTDQRSMKTRPTKHVLSEVSAGTVAAFGGSAKKLS